MTVSTKRLRTLLAVLGAVLLLAACGTDDLTDDEPAPGEDPAADPGEEPADDPDDPEADDPDDPDDAEEGAIDPPEDPDTLVVGSANFPEQIILGNMYLQALEAAGVDVTDRFNIGSREILYPALQGGDIDLLPEYAGALLGHLTGETREADTDALVEDLRAEVADDGLEVLEPAPAQNTDLLVTTPEIAEEYGLETVSDLEPVADELTLGGPPELRERWTGLVGLEEVYGVEFGNFQDTDVGGPLTVQALADGDIDVARLFSTDPVIPQRGWVVLEEDEPWIPAQNIVPVIRSEALTDEIADVLNRLSAALTTEDLTELNRRVAEDREDPDDLAEEWLTEHGFLD